MIKEEIQVNTFIIESVEDFFQSEEEQMSMSKENLLEIEKEH
ncbi:MAG: hypothetical protein ACK5LM_05785 [Lactovum sp.]